jgi:hypothetical protein
LWTAYREPKGYGRCWFRGSVRKAHHVAMLLAGIERRLAHVITWTCDNRACMRVEHFVQLPVGEASLRSGACARNAAKLLCKRGHELVPLSAPHDGRVHRVCPVCVRAMRKLRKPKRKPLRMRPCAECARLLTTVTVCGSCARRALWRDPDYRARVLAARAARREAARVEALVPSASCAV